MTRDDVIRMARESGLQDPMTFVHRYERFASLVRNATLEEAAGVCDVHARGWENNPGVVSAASGFTAASNCAFSLRAMKEKA